MTAQDSLEALSPSISPDSGSHFIQKDSPTKLPTASSKIIVIGACFEVDGFARNRGNLTRAKILILGGSGMLGSQVTKALAEFDPEVPSRKQLDLRRVPPAVFKDFDIVVNCAGQIPQRNPSRDELFAINTELVRTLSRTGKRVIHFSSDCVFSGNRGGYIESSNMDATDDYGVSKARADILAQDLTVLRASIVGPDSSGRSLAGWVAAQRDHSEVTGYIDHLWNGVTSVTISKVVRGIVEEDLFHQGVRHFVPKNVVSKAQLVRLIASKIGKHLTVTDTLQGAVDKTLSTSFPVYNETLWRIAGWHSPPTVSDMLQNDF